ncbi:MAG: hypothetical protein ACYC75_03330 [Minisyncoccota bacterium]
MSNFRTHFSFSPLSLCYAAVGVLLVTYIGLIAAVMSYAALTVEFSQSVKNDEGTVATLESQYLASVERITNTDYQTEGYTAPIAEIFVPAKSATALR